MGVAPNTFSAHSHAPFFNSTLVKTRSSAFSVYQNICWSACLSIRCPRRLHFHSCTGDVWVSRQGFDQSTPLLLTTFLLSLPFRQHLHQTTFALNPTRPPTNKAAMTCIRPKKNNNIQEGDKLSSSSLLVRVSSTWAYLQAEDVGFRHRCIISRSRTPLKLSRVMHMMQKYTFHAFTNIR